MHDFVTSTAASTTVGATANVLAGDFLTGLVGVPTVASIGTVAALQNQDAASASLKLAQVLTPVEHPSTSTPFLQLPASSPTNSNEVNYDFDQLGIG